MTTIGFRVRTAKATVLIVSKSGDTFQVEQRGELPLWDPAVPVSQAPYHAELELAPEKAAAAVRLGCEAAMEAGRRSVGELIGRMHQEGRRIAAAGVVISKNPDLSKLYNPHVRAHAAEGILYRRAVESGVEACGLKFVTVLEKELAGQVQAFLGWPKEKLDRVLGQLGVQAGRPWTAREKQAAMAALLAWKVVK